MALAAVVRDMGLAFKIRLKAYLGKFQLVQLSYFSKFSLV